MGGSGLVQTTPSKAFYTIRFMYMILRVLLFLMMRLLLSINLHLLLPLNSRGEYFYRKEASLLNWRFIIFMRVRNQR